MQNKGQSGAPRKGDIGVTKLGNNEAIKKTSSHIFAMASLDTLMSHINACVKSAKGNQAIIDDLKYIYAVLFDVCSIMSLNKKRNIEKDSRRKEVIGATDYLDARIKAIKAQLPNLSRFLDITETHEACVAFEFARTACRQCEPNVVNAIDHHKEAYCKIYGGFSSIGGNTGSGTNTTDKGGSSTDQGASSEGIALQEPELIVETRKFINRLSLYLFTALRQINAMNGLSEIYR